MYHRFNVSMYTVLVFSTCKAYHIFFQQRARDHKEKLTLQDLMIMPVQRIPRYVLIITVSKFNQYIQKVTSFIPFP